MLHPDPLHRMTIAQAYQHAWMSQGAAADDLGLTNSLSSLSMGGHGHGHGQGHGHGAAYPTGDQYSQKAHHHPDHSKRDGTSRDLELALSLANEQAPGFMPGQVKGGNSWPPSQGEEMQNQPPPPPPGSP